MDVTPTGRPDDPESSDAAELDGVDHDVADVDAPTSAGSPLELTPQTGRHAETADRRRSPKAMVAVGALVVIVVALGAVLLTGLRDASTFFYNVDEADQQRDELSGDRIRMQGNVVPDSVERSADGVRFVIAYNGVEVPVDHVGDPPELFGPKIPVVLEGSFTGDRFSSDEILIRHDSAYDEQNPDRVRDAQRDADQQGGAG